MTFEYISFICTQVTENALLIIDEILSYHSQGLSVASQLAGQSAGFHMIFRYRYLAGIDHHRTVYLDAVNNTVSAQYANISRRFRQ